MNFRKTRVMHRSARQLLAGIVINQWPNVRRVQYDRLKAILHNCVEHGHESQNRHGHHEFKAYLAGQIGFVASVNPQRAKRLRALFDNIVW